MVGVLTFHLEKYNKIAILPKITYYNEFKK